MAFPKRNHQFGHSYWSLILASSEGKVEGYGISGWSPKVLSKNKTPVLPIQRSPETISETCKCYSILTIYHMISLQSSLTPARTGEIRSHSKAQRSQSLHWPALPHPLLHVHKPFFVPIEAVTLKLLRLSVWSVGMSKEVFLKQITWHHWKNEVST